MAIAQSDLEDDPFGEVPPKPKVTPGAASTGQPASGTEQSAPSAQQPVSGSQQSVLSESLPVPGKDVPELSLDAQPTIPDPEHEVDDDAVELIGGTVDPLFGPADENAKTLTFGQPALVLRTSDLPAGFDTEDGDGIEDPDVPIVSVDFTPVLTNKEYVDALYEIMTSDSSSLSEKKRAAITVLKLVSNKVDEVFAEAVLDAAYEILETIPVSSQKKVSIYQMRAFFQQEYAYQNRLGELFSMNEEELRQKVNAYFDQKKAEISSNAVLSSKEKEAEIKELNKKQSKILDRDSIGVHVSLDAALDAELGLTIDQRAIAKGMRRQRQKKRCEQKLYDVLNRSGVLEARNVSYVAISQNNDDNTIAIDFVGKGNKALSELTYGFLGLNGKKTASELAQLRIALVNAGNLANIVLGEPLIFHAKPQPQNTLVNVGLVAGVVLLGTVIGLGISSLRSSKNEVVIPVLTPVVVTVDSGTHVAKEVPTEMPRQVDAQVLPAKPDAGTVAPPPVSISVPTLAKAIKTVKEKPKPKESLAGKTCTDANLNAVLGRFGASKTLIISGKSACIRGTTTCKRLPFDCQKKAIAR